MTHSPDGEYSPATGRWIFLLLSAAVAAATACLEPPAASDPDAAAWLPVLMTQYPEPVSTSPDEQYLLVKTRYPDAFEIAVLDRESHRVVATDRSFDTQLSLTWRPDGKTILFQESEGGNRRYRFYELDLETGQRRGIETPITLSAEPPLRWAPTGDAFAYVHMDPAGARLLLVETGARFRFPAPKPRLVAEHVFRDADFRWSPDGGRIATVLHRRPGALALIDVATGERENLPVLQQGMLRDVAWSPTGEEILVTARRQEDEYFSLWLVSLKDRHSTLLVAPKGDVERPLWLKKTSGALYHLSREGAVDLFHLDLPTRRERLLSPAPGITSAQSLPADETRVTVLHRSEVAPPALGSVSLGEPGRFEVFHQAAAHGLAGSAPESVVLRSSDGESLPAYVWRAPSDPEHPPRALILVHGWGHVTPPVWDAGRQLLLLNGVSVIAINYRGSTGYGATFAAAGDGAGRVRDIAAAHDYARRQLQVSPEDLVLLGSSYGSSLVAQAAASPGLRFGCLVLISMVSTPELPASAGRSTGCVLAFHGQNDPVLSPHEARTVIHNVLGSRVFDHPVSTWRVFEEEGHFFQRTASWAGVYARIIKYYDPPSAVAPVPRTIPMAGPDDS